MNEQLKNNRQDAHVSVIYSSLLSVGQDGLITATAIVTVTKRESSDDDKITLAKLKGTWDMIKCDGWEYNDKGVKEDGEEDVKGEYIFFEDVDGNGGYNDGYKTYYFASSINGNKLVLRNSD